MRILRALRSFLEAFGGRHELSCPVERAQAHAETDPAINAKLDQVLSELQKVKDQLDVIQARVTT